MRFHTRLCLNGKAVSRGYGPNKLEAKKSAARIFIELLYPRVYREWLADKGFSQPLMDPTPLEERQTQATT